MSDSLQPHGLQPTRLHRSWHFPGKSTGVGCHFLLQEIVPTQGLNPGLLHCRWILYRLSSQGSPGSRPEELLNIPHSTGQPPTTKDCSGEQMLTWRDHSYSRSFLFCCSQEWRTESKSSVFFPIKCLLSFGALFLETVLKESAGIRN